MLSDAKVKSLKPADKLYSVSDGEGLTIDVLPSGKKKWTLSYRKNGKQSRKRIGNYPDIGCNKARQMARETKQALIGKPSNHMPLQAVMDEYIAMNAQAWTSQKYYDTVVYRLSYIAEDFKDKDINDITRQDVANKVKQMIAKGTIETAQRALRLLKKVFDFAISSDYANQNPCLLVEVLIPKRKTQHYPCLSADKMPEFFRRLKVCNANANTKTALILACYTGVRISELLNARFDTGEFDFNNQTWTIPAHRMKQRKDLLVPLAPSVLAIFQSLYDHRHNDGYVFKNRNDPTRPMTSNAVLNTIKRLGYEGQMVTHGFRALFSTHANASGLFRTQVIEYQIAHVNKSTQDATAKIYNRADYLDERRALMNWYALQVDAWLGDFWQY